MNVFDEPKIDGHVHVLDPARYPYGSAVAFTLEHCVWASDWPFLRAPRRQDYGPLVEPAGRLFPDAVGRRKLFWDTPQRLLGFRGVTRVSAA